MKSIAFSTIQVALLLLISYFLSSQCIAQKIPVCQKHDNQKIINIDLYPAYQKRDYYPLSLVAKSIEYIPLETKDNNMMGSLLSRIYTTSKEILVFDYGQAAYRFTRDGKFINKIGKIGRGPGECAKPIDMILDSINKSVIFLDYDKLVKYDFSGNFIKSYKLNFKSDEIVQYKDGVWLLNDAYYNYQKSGQRFSLKFYSEKSEKLISQIACEKTDKIPFSFCDPILYNYNKQTYIKDYWSDTIYQVLDPFNLKAYAVIKTGRFKHRDVEDRSMITGKTGPEDTWIVDISHISETDRFIFLTSNKGVFIHDKVQNETFCCNAIIENNHESLFRNDLTTGPDTKAFYLNNTVNNNTHICYIEALPFFDKNSNKLKTGLNASLKNLRPNDNQVLVIIKFKSN